MRTGSGAEQVDEGPDWAAPGGVQARRSARRPCHPFAQPTPDEGRMWEGLGSTTSPGVPESRGMASSPYLSTVRGRRSVLAQVTWGRCSGTEGSEWRERDAAGATTPAGL